MKLELKYLSPYLPYDVRIARFTANDKFKRVEYSLRAGNLQEVVRCDNLKPILRPLSDLTKEINLHDDFFAIPIENMTGYKLDGNISVAPTTVRYLYGCSKGEIEAKFLDYWVIVQLLEWHFDIFNLIENNLAIDINTINQ